MFVNILTFIKLIYSEFKGTEWVDKFILHPYIKFRVKLFLLLIDFTIIFVLKIIKFDSDFQLFSSDNNGNIQNLCQARPISRCKSGSFAFGSTNEKYLILTCLQVCISNKFGLTSAKANLFKTKINLSSHSL